MRCVTDSRGTNTSKSRDISQLGGNRCNIQGMRNLSKITAIIGASLLLATTKLAAASLEDEQIFAEKMQALMVAKDFDYAHAVMLKYLEMEPDAAPVMRELAHYHMKTTWEETDDLIGYRYPDESGKKIVELLDQSLEITPNDHLALSLLVYTHALQGNTELGQQALDKAYSLEDRAPWLPYNAALLAIRKNQLSDAVDLLAPIARNRTASSNAKEAERIYRAAWLTWLKIAMLKPELDPLDAIRDDLVTRVAIDELPEYLHEYDPSGPPIILNLSSHDRRCTYCVPDLPVLYKFAQYSKANGSPYHIIHASIQPWADAKQHANMLKGLRITGAPAYNLIHNGFHLEYKSGSNLEQLKALVDNVDEVLAESKRVLKVLPRKDYQLDLVYGYFRKYKKHDPEGFKASAYVIDDNFLTVRTAYEHKTQDEADEAALSACNQTIEEANRDSACKIYARGRRIVDPEGLARNEARQNELKRTYGKKKKNKASQNSAKSALKAKPNKNKSQSGNKPNKKLAGKSNKQATSQTTQGTTTTAKDAIREFAKIDEHFKALALAEDEDASVSGTASGEITQSRANSRALLNCNVAKQDFDIAADCALHTIGQKEVTDNSEETIAKLTARQQKRNVKNSPLKSSHSKYRKFSTDKAFAYSADTEGNWAYGIAFGKRGIEKATTEALEKCEQQRLKKNLPDECTVLMLNSKFVE